MSNNTGATAPSEQPADGPLSLDDLFNAELASSGQSADRPDSPEDLAAPGEHASELQSHHQISYAEFC